MNKIGFKNFRKFQNFPTIDLGDITILVGGNNAGKSTLVKAMLLMRDFLKSRIESVEKSDNVFSTFEPIFSFDSEHVNIGDFYRAFCYQSPNKENTISFTMKIDNFQFVVNVRGERKPGVIPHVSMIAVSDEEREVSFVFDFSKRQMTIRFDYDRKSLNNHVYEAKEDLLDREANLLAKLNMLENKLKNSKDLEMITSIKLEIAKIQMELNHIKSIRKREEYDSITGVSIEEYETLSISMSYFKSDNIGKLIIPELIMGFVRYSETASRGDKRSSIYKDKEAKKAFIRGKAIEITTIAEEIENVLNKQEIEYIYAHSVNQDSVYAKCANSSDYTKRTIHEFYTARISRGDDEFSLIENWLKEFNIGVSLKVIPYKGDNYSLVIFDEENPEITSDKRKGYPGGIDLADKGMGSIQIVILLLRIATLIRKYKGQHLTILLEEPEQNLHPALQSKLAELLDVVGNTYDLHFVIETHSEYLVRHTQVLAAKKIYEEGISLSEVNKSVKVYYISQERGIVDMLFLDNAKFQDTFDEGFFDQASREALTISRLERLNRTK